MPNSRTSVTDDGLRKYLNLIAGGCSERQAAALVEIPRTSLNRYIAKNPQYQSILDRARGSRNVVLTLDIQSTMMQQIRKGSTWWTKLAISSYKLPFNDPDVVDLRRREMQKILDGIMQKIIPFVPEDRRAEVAEVLERSVSAL